MGYCEIKGEEFPPSPFIKILNFYLRSISLADFSNTLESLIKAALT